MLKDFKYRRNYLNFNVIKHFVDGHLHKDNCILPGFLPIEIDYELTDGKEGTLTLPPCESIYFSMNPRTKRRKILENILHAQQNSKAAKNLSNEINDFVDEQPLELKKMKFAENDYIIPSCSPKMYDIDIISHKGNNLLHLIQEGYPVPDFCILTSNAYFVSPGERSTYL